MEKVEKIEKMEEQSEELRDKAKEKIKTETSEETADRIKGVLGKREEALEKIKEYQEKTGIPTEEEAEKHFIINEANMDYNEYKNSENEVEDEV